MRRYVFFLVAVRVALAGPLTYSTDLASLHPGNFTVSSIPGLQPDDFLADFSFGNDRITKSLLFSVDRVALGTPGYPVNILSTTPGIEGANGYVFQNLDPIGHSIAFTDVELGLDGGVLGDDIHGLNNMPRTRNVYFTLEIGSPTLAGGYSTADVLINGASIFAGHSTMGLDPEDEIDGLILFDKARIGQLDPGQDVALFTINSFSPSSIIRGGFISPADIRMTSFLGGSSPFLSATELGLRPDDELQAIATAIPEPASGLLILVGIVALVFFRRARSLFAILITLVGFAATGLKAAENCAILAGPAPQSANAVGNLILPDLAAKKFRWLSNDATFPNFDSGVITVTEDAKWVITRDAPIRVVFEGVHNGITIRGNVLLSKENRGTVDLIQGDKRVRFLVVLPKLEVSRLIFDHMDPDTNETDGLRIRFSKAKALTHLGSKGEGEWIKKPARNEPALWVSNKNVIIKVRFTLNTEYLEKADVFATAKASLLPNVKSANVSFKDGISDPEYVAFELEKPTPDSINKAIETWDWKLGNLNGCGTEVVPFDTSGPHTVYTMIETPKDPWYVADKAGKNLDDQWPWVSALDWLVEKAKLGGTKTTDDAAKKITEFIHKDYKLRYDAANGSSSYMTYITTEAPGSRVDLASNPKTFQQTFQLTKFLGPTVAKVNCFDLAGALAALVPLTGGSTEYKEMFRFGYMKKASLIGIGEANNPFYESKGSFSPVAVVKDGSCLEDAIDPAPAVNFSKRSYFKTHGFVFYNAKVLDATVGPHTGTEVFDAAYLNNSIDKSMEGQRTCKARSGDANKLQAMKLAIRVE